MKDRTYLVYCENCNTPGVADAQSARHAVKIMRNAKVNGRALNLKPIKVVVQLTGEVVPEELWK